MYPPAPPLGWPYGLAPADAVPIAGLLDREIAPAAPVIRGIRWPVTGSSSPSSTAPGSSSTLMRRLAAVSQLGIGGSASSLTGLGSIAIPFGPVSKRAYDGAGEKGVPAAPPPDIMGSGALYPLCGAKAGGKSGSSRCLCFLSGESQHPQQLPQHLRQLKQAQQQDMPQQQQRMIHQTTERTMRPPTMMAAIIGHLDLLVVNLS